MIELYYYVIDNIYQLLGVIFSVIYVTLSIKQNILCWPTLIIAAVFNMLAYYIINLPLQVVMQLFFISTAIYGWYNWSKKTKQTQIKINSWRPIKHIYCILMGLILTYILGFYHGNCLKI